MSTMLCDPKVWTRCPGHECCGFPADFNEGSECDRYNQKVLSELPADGWISVTARLPEKGERVLAVSLSGRVDIGRRTIGMVFVNPAGSPMYTITNWMPLPEPPKDAT